MEEHKRAQLEIYNKIGYRQKIMDLFFVSSGLFLSSIAFIIQKNIDSLDKIYQDAPLAFLFLCCMGFCAICSVLFNNFITHTGHIYTAAVYIADHVSSRFSEIMTFLNKVAPQDTQLKIEIFKWEKFLYRRRAHYGFHDRYGDEVLLLLIPFFMVLVEIYLLYGAANTTTAPASSTNRSWAIGVFCLGNAVLMGYHLKSCIQYWELRKLRRSLARWERRRDLKR